jgi:hypothetical protein
MSPITFDGKVLIFGVLGDTGYRLNSWAFKNKNLIGAQKHGHTG